MEQYYTTYLDENGEVKPVEVHIVWGAPASGKTTYVKEHMQVGDLVVDLDYIKQAISMQKKLDCPDSLLPIALELREMLYDMIEKRKVNCRKIWVIAGLPGEHERRELQRRLKAELIHIDTSYDECIKRSKEDRERTDKPKAEFVTQKWFERYESG